MWRLKNSFFSISSFLAFKKLKKTFFVDFRVTVQISEAKRQVKNKQQEDEIDITFNQIIEKNENDSESEEKNNDRFQQRNQLESIKNHL